MTGLLQWFLFTAAVSNPGNLRTGVYLDLGFVILLLLLRWHLGYWEKQLRYYSLEAKYLGVDFK